MKEQFYIGVAEIGTRKKSGIKHKEKTVLSGLVAAH